MKQSANKKGFILVSVLVIVMVLSTLALTRLKSTYTRSIDLTSTVANTKLLYIAESGLSRAQASAHDEDQFNALAGQEFKFGGGTYIIEGDISGFTKEITVKSYMPDTSDVRYSKDIKISGASLTSNYTWEEL
jgi:type II secretory pathway pseudopilin PulG